MTEQEAKGMLEAKLTCMKLDDKACFGEGCDRDCDACDYMYGQGTRGEHEEALEMGIKALEKQIAKKPYLEGDGYADGNLVYDTWICPNCETHYEVDYDDYDYCPNCGQKIDKSVFDWGNEDAE